MKIQFQRPLLSLIFLSLIFLGQLDACRAQQSRTILEVKQTASLVKNCDFSIQLLDFQRFLRWLARDETINEELYSDLLSHSEPAFRDTTDEYARLIEVLTKVEQVHVFARTAGEDSSFNFLVICNLKEASKAEVTRLSNFASQSLSVTLNDNDELNFASPQDRFHYGYTGNRFYFSNDLQWTNDTAKAIAGPNDIRNSLAADRRFLRALSSAPQRDYVFFSYFQPRLFKASFRANIPSEALKLEDLSSGSFFAWIDSSDCLVGTGEISNTFPAKGIPEIWNCLKPLTDLPNTSLDVVEFYGDSWKPDELYELTKQQYDSVKGEGEFKLRQDKINKTHPLMDPHSLLLRSDQRFSIRYLAEMDRRELIGIEFRKNSRISIAELTQTILKVKPHKEFCELEPFKGAVIIGYPEEIIKKRRQDALDGLRQNPKYYEVYLEIEKETFERFKKLNSLEEDEEQAKFAFAELLVERSVDNDGFLISDDWFLRGDLNEIKKQYEYLLEHNEPTADTQRIKTLLAESDSVSGNKDRHVRVHYDKRNLEFRESLQKIFGFKLPLRPHFKEITELATREPPVDSEEAETIIASNILLATIASFETSCKDRILVFYKNESLEYYFKLTTNN